VTLRREWEPWRRTVVRFGAGGPEVNLAEPVPATMRAAFDAIGLTGSFAIITPCNPAGTLLDPPANATRLAVATQSLASRNLPGVPAVGHAPDDSHAEPGWALVIDRIEAVALAREWEQAGFYWWDGSRFWIVPTDAGLDPVALPSPPSGAG